MNEDAVLEKTIELVVARWTGAGSHVDYIVATDEDGGNVRVNGGPFRIIFRNSTDRSVSITFTKFQQAGKPDLRWPFEESGLTNPLAIAVGQSQELTINGKQQKRWSGLMVFKYTVEAEGLHRLDPTIIVDN